MERMDDNSMDAKLDALWSEYRSALPDPEASPNFMPNLWQKIEARRLETTSVFRRMAQACVMATVALTLVIVVLIPRIEREPVYTATLRGCPGCGAPNGCRSTRLTVEGASNETYALRDRALCGLDLCQRRDSLGVFRYRQRLYNASTASAKEIKTPPSPEEFRKRAIAEYQRVLELFHARA